MPADWQVLQVASSGCPPKEETRPRDGNDYCRFSNSFAAEAIQKAKPETVVVAQNTGHDLEAMYRIRAFLEAAGVRRIIFTGPGPHWYHALPDVLLAKLWPETPQYSAVALDTSFFAKDRQLALGFKPDGRSEYVSLIASFCDGARCLTRIGEDRMLGITTIDYGHLSLVASDYFARQILVQKIVAGQ
jgi:hypothetical protein